MTVQCDYSIGDQQAESGRDALFCRCPEEQGCPDGGPGLSTAHISPLGYVRVSSDVNLVDAYMEYYPGAHLIKVKHSSYKLGNAQGGGGDRGEITLYSRQSHKRLMNLLGTIEKTQLPVFLTLTYPDEFSINSRKWKRDLDTFFKRMARKFPGSSGIWKLEPQRRGAPHYHMLIWGVTYYDLLVWVSSAWYEVVGSGDEKHLRAGTRVENIRSWRGLRSYAAKYMGKIFDMPIMIESGWGQPGRFWGVYGRKYLPVAAAELISGLDDKTIYDLFRLMRKYADFKGRRYRSLTISVENPSQWAQCAKYLNSC